MTAALTGLLIRLITRHGLTQGPRVARQLGFSTKAIQKAFSHSRLNKYPMPDGRKLRYGNRIEQPSMNYENLLEIINKIK